MASTVSTLRLGPTDHVGVLTLAQYQEAVEVAMRDRRRIRKGRPSPR
jgi:hypothetical protein